jgi:hypothetical protein
MITPRKALMRAWLIVPLLALAGCGSMQSSPDNPTGAGGLTPNVKDKDAGLVALAPGFDISKYKVVVVDKFPVTDPGIEDEGDRLFAAKMTNILQLELVRRLRESALFQRVVNTSETNFEPGAEPALRLQGAITRLGRGSQAARAFAGLYGAGRARAQADMRFEEVASRSVVMVTADRRIASYAPFSLGGSDIELLEESFNDMARDLARFLVRLSKGEAPRQ